MATKKSITAPNDPLEQSHTTDITALFDWEIHNALLGLEAIGEALDPEVGVADCTHPGLHEKLQYTVWPLAMFARARLREMLTAMEAHDMGKQYCAPEARATTAESIQ